MASGAERPSFIESSFSTKAEYEAWLQGCEAGGKGGAALTRCVTDVYACCPQHDPRCSIARPSARCVSSRPSVDDGLDACQCGRLHFGQFDSKRKLWASTCAVAAATDALFAAEAHTSACTWYM